MRHLPEEEWDITVAGLPVYWLFPNVILMLSRSASSSRALLDRNDPGRHSKVDFYIRRQTRPAQENQARQPDGDRWEIASTFSRIIRDEDMAVLQSVSLRKRFCVRADHLYRNEPALHHYHKTYRRMLGMQIRSCLGQAKLVDVRKPFAIGHHATARPSSANSADVETRFEDRSDVTIRSHNDDRAITHQVREQVGLVSTHEHQLPPSGPSHQLKYRWTPW